MGQRLSFLAWVGLIAGSYVLTAWTPLGPVLRMFNTLVHEMGHAVAALATQGQVQRMALNPDLSGVTQVAFSAPWAGVVIGLAGYMISPIWAAGMLRAVLGGRELTVLRAHVALVAIALLVFVRNPFGLIWGLIAGAALVLALAMGPWLRRVVALSLAVLLAEQAITSPLVLLVAALRSPGQAGDATLLMQQTGVPALAWAALLAVFAMVVLWVALAARRRG